MTNLEYKIIPRDDFTVLRLVTDTKMDSDIKALRNAVQEILDSGSKKIAISFTPSSLLNSLAIGTLVICAKLVDDAKGEFVIVQPNIEESYMLEVLQSTCLMNTCSSEDELETFLSKF